MTQMISWVNLILFRRFSLYFLFFTLNGNRTKDKQTTGSLVIGSEAERSMMTGEHNIQTGFGKQILGIGRKLGNEEKAAQVKRKEISIPDPMMGDHIGFPSVPFVSPSPSGATTIY